MAAEPTEDPFSDHLFPHILRDMMDFDPSPETQGSELLDNILESLVLKGSKNLLDQALAIRLCSPGIENLYSEAEGVPSMENSKAKDSRDHPLGRRLALGRQRPLFHTQSDSSANYRIYDIVEPQEHFSVVDQMQSNPVSLPPGGGGEELKKYRYGSARDLAEHHQSTTVYNHHPVLRGVSLYKSHLSTNIDTSDTFRASQGVGPDRRISSPATVLTDEESCKILHFETTKKEFSHATRVNNETSDDVEEGSIAETKKQFKDLSDQLFSSYDDLDGGTGVSLSNNKFPIKSADVNVMTAPELDSMRRDDLETLESTVRNKEPEGYQHPEKVSPATTMQGHVAMKDHLAVPVSATDTAPHLGDDFSNICHGEQPLSSTSGITGVGSSTPVVVSRKRSSTEDKMDLPIHEAEITNDIKIVSEEVLKHCNCVTNASTAHDGNLEKEGYALQLNASVGPQKEAVAKNLISILLIQNHMDVLASPLSSDLNGNSSRIYVGLGSSGRDLTLQDEVHTVVQGESQSDAEISRGKPTTPRASLQGHRRSKIQSILHEENKEIWGFHEASQVSPGMEQKRKTPPSEKKNKILTSKRLSHSEGKILEDAGLTWKSGVRQSTRRKSTPSKHLLNEGYIYGKIDDSKPTTPRASLRGHRRSEIQSILHEENKEIRGFDEASEVSPGMEHKRKTPPSEKNSKKLTSKRLSHSEGKILEDAGLTWKLGVRQSTRRKSTPSKHRLNEGYIFGKIDDSKPTTPRASLQGHRRSEIQSILHEENKEIQGFQEASQVSPGMEQKRKTPPSEKKNKKLTLKRLSHSEGKFLEDAGLTWKSGVRQSTRRKSTPSKHRLNEGYIYGKIDDSLLRAVGLKFTRPCDESKEPVVKMKSLKIIMVSSK